MTTETGTTETGPAETAHPLITNALYTKDKELHLAVSEMTLERLYDPDHRQLSPDSEFEFHSHPGSPEWIEQMVLLRTTVLQNVRYTRADLVHARTELSNLHQYVERLGEALLEKAVEKDWCEEYDEFALEWELPVRERDFEVTVTVRVRARDEDAAEELVGENFSLSMYDNALIDGPSFDTREC